MQRAINIRKFVLLLPCIILYVLAMAQTQKRWTIAPSAGTIFAHSVDVENTKGSTPIGIQLDYSWQHTDSNSFQTFSSLPFQGVSLSAFHFDNTILGNGYTLAYYLEPQLRIGKRAGIAFPAAIGLSYLTNPYNPKTNAGNNSYSTHFIVYLGLSLQPYVEINKKLQLGLSASYRHVSNSGIKLPNRGVNWITAELTARYFIKPQIDMQQIIKHHKQYKSKKQNRFDVCMFGASRSINSESSARYGVYGAGLLHSWQTGATHALTLGAEAYNDIGAGRRMKNDGIEGRSSVRSGLMFGHEFLWGKFRFSQQVGIYVFDQTPYYSSWYHRWGLLYGLNKHISAGFVIKAHKHVAAFPDVRLVYSFLKYTKS